MRTSSAVSRILAFGIMLTFLAAVLPGAGIAAGADARILTLSSIEKPGKGHLKLDSVLDQLAATARTGGPGATASFAHRRNIHLVEGKAKVVIEAEPGMVGAAKKAAAALGADIDATYKGLVRVQVPAASLTALANNPAVRLVRQPWKPVPLAVSEGVTMIDADDWQSAGYTGSGVKIGIVDVGYAGYAALKGTELPASVTTRWFGSGETAGSNPHGTACAEIIYDIAPDAEFYLTNVDDAIDFGNAVDWLIAQGVDVISCSLGWMLTGPGDGTGLVSNKVTEARAAGILWANSAGNQARRNWVGTWQDNNGNDLHDFVVGVDETNAIYAYAGYSIIVGLRWNDTWGASGNDYDLYLFDNTLTQVAYSWNEQNGNDDPAEFIVFTAPYTGWYHIVIAKYLAISPVTFQLLTFDWNLQYQTASQSIMEPADSPGAVAVGAVPWSSPTSLEVFSSQGPTSDGRTKPDLVAPDGVSGASYGASNGLAWGSGGTGFFGTSASAPHVAGAAALVKNAYPSYTPAQVQSFLETRAIDLGATGKDNLFGSGLLNLGAIPEEPPAVTTSAATSVTTNSATLNATLDDLGTASPVYVSFEWGTTVAYGNETAPQEMTTPSSVTAGLSDLQPGITYHFRAKAAGDGTGYGSDLTFATGTLPPSVTTDAATNVTTSVTTSSATLNATLDDLGTASSVDVTFEWGTTVAYGNETAPQAMTATGNVTAGLSGLQPGITYHFRAKAAGDGTDYGDDLTFAASTLPPSVTTQPAMDVTSDSADLVLLLNALGTASSVDISFQWATDDYYSSHSNSYEHETPSHTTSTGGTWGYTLDGILQPDTTYHFRARAAGDGTDYGSDRSFETCIPGDANMDGIIDGRDVIRAKKIILGLEDPTPGADANMDELIDGRDVIRIKKMILGIADP